jgi:hypothetical protein
MDIIVIQKIGLAVALAGTLLIILRKAMRYQREEREQLDAEPRSPEPLRSDQLRVAQNAPL